MGYVPTVPSIQIGGVSMEEIWKEIKNYEGLYEISNLGRVRSLDKVTITTNGRRFPFKGRILKNKRKQMVI